MTKQINSKKIKKTRVIIGIACLALAAVITFVGIPVAVNLTTSKVPVLMTTKNIGRGEQITDSNSSIVMLGRDNLPNTVISAMPSDGKPLYADMEISANNFVTKENTTDVKQSIESLTNLPDGKVAISFTFNGVAASFDNQFQAGDIVQFLCYYSPDSVYAVTGKTTEKGVGLVESNKMLQYVKLHSVNNEFGSEVKNSQKDEVKYTNATVIVTQKQAEEIVRLEHEGLIHLTLIYRYDGSSVDKTNSYIAAQDAYLKTLK